MRMAAWIAWLLVLAVSGHARAGTVATVASPDGRITVSLALDGDGRPSYRVKHDGRALLGDSRLGFIFANGAHRIEHRHAGTPGQQQYGCKHAYAGQQSTSAGSTRYRWLVAALSTLASE